MTQAEMDFGDEVEIRAKVVLSLEAAKRQFEELGGSLSGMAGQAAAKMGIGTRGANADAEPTRTKEQDERAKVRTSALQTLAKSMPGGGLMASMASSFKGGGIMAGMATGITAVVGILTSIMKSSQVFQTMAGTVFKILGMMADLFLMPFVPLMMKFASWMISHMPEIQAAGEKVANFIEKLVNIFTWGGKKEEEGEKQGGLGGFGKQLMGLATRPSTYMMVGGAVTANPLLFAGGVAARGAGMQFGHSDSVGGGGPRMVVGGGGGDLTGESQGFSNKIASWIQRFQQKEMGPGGVMERWYDKMFGGSIMPDIWNNIGGFFGGIETETGSINTRVTSDTEGLENERKSFWDKLKFWEYLPEIWGKVKGFFIGIGTTLKDFFTFDLPEISLGSAADLVKACFDRAKNAVWGFFSETIPNAMRSAVKQIVDGAKWTWGGLGSVAGWIWDKMKAAGDAVWNFFSNTIPTIAGEAADAIVAAAKWTWGGVSWIASKVWAGLKIAGDAIWKFFTEILPNFAVDAAKAVAGAAVWTWGAASSAARWVWGVLSDAAGAIKGFFTDTLLGWALDAFSSIKRTIDNLASGAISIAGAIGVYLGVAKDKVFSFFQDTVLGWVTSGWSQTVGAISGVGSIIWSAFGNIGDLIQRAKDAVSDFIEGLWEDIRSVPGRILSGLNPWSSRQFGSSSSYYSDDMYAFGSSMNHFGGGGGAGGGPRFAMGVPGGGGGGVTSNRVVNVNINSSMSIDDIVRDVERLDSIQEAAFFNTV